MFRESFIINIVIRDKMSQLGSLANLAKLQEVHRAIREWVLTEAMDERDRGKHDTLASLQRMLCEKPTAYMYAVGSERLCCMTYGGRYVVIPVSFWALPLKTIEDDAKLDGAVLENLRKELLENPLKYMHRTEDGSIWCMCYDGYYVCVSKDSVSL